MKKNEAVTSTTTVAAITVEFSEPVQSVGVAKIGEEYANIINNTDGTYSISYSANSGKNLEVGKSYEVTISNVVDFAGNSAPEIKATVTVTRDEVKPTFTIKPVNGKTFDVVFDKEMSNTQPTYDAITVKNDKDVTVGLAALPELQSDKKTFRVTLAQSPIDTGKSSAVISVKVSTLKDKVGNEVSVKTENVTLSQDLVKPELVSAKISSLNKNVIEVTFSEKVEDIQGSDFVLTNTDTKAALPIPNVLDAANGITTVTTTNKDNKVFLNYSTLPNGKYTLALKVGSVKDTSGNTNLAKAIDLTQSSQAATPLNVKIENKYSTNYNDATVSLGTSTASDKNNRKFVITFDSADLVDGTLDGLTGDFKVGSAANPANYTIGGQTLPTGTVVTFKDNVNYGFAGATATTVDMVEINLSDVDEKLLPDAFKNGGDVQVTATGVKTNAGAIAYTSAVLKVTDATAPKMTSAYLKPSTVNATNNYTLVVNFNEKIKGTINPAEFEIFGLQSDGTTPSNAASSSGIVVTSADAKTIEIEVTKAAIAAALIDLTKGSLKVVATAGHGVTDDANVSLADDAEVTVTPWVTAALTIPTAHATTPITAANGTGTATTIDAGDKITIKFSEAVDATKIIIANFIVNNRHSFGTGATITPQIGSSDTFVITLGTGTDIVANDTIIITAANVVSTVSGIPASANVVFTVPVATQF